MPLKLLTYNVKLLPDLGRAAQRPRRPVVRGHQNRFSGAWWEQWMMDAARTKRLITAIAASDHDIVCLQEVFDEDRRKQLKRGLKRAGYAHFVDYSADGDPLHEDSGLFVASRYPVRWEHFEEYQGKHGADAWADKGVSCIALDVGRGLSKTTLILFHTHMQADQGKKHVAARGQQIAQLGRKLSRVARKLRDPASCAVVVCGDFNIVAEKKVGGRLRPTAEYKRLRRQLGKHRDLYRSKHRAAAGYTSDGPRNRRMKRGRGQSRLDHVYAVDSLPRIAGQLPAVRLRKLKCEQACIEEFFDAGKDGHLSDHFGVSVTLAR